MPEDRILTGTDIDRAGPLIRRLAGSTALAAGRGIDPDSPEGITLAADRLEHILKKGEVEAIGHVGPDGLNGLMLWSPLSWDTAVTGVDCARILLLGGEGCGSLCAFWKETALGRGIRYATARLPDSSSEYGRQCDALAGTGFSELEKIVYLKAECGEVEDVEGVDIAGPEDIGELREIARVSYSFDRFHADPVFDRQTADKVHEEWMRGSFEGRADAVLALRSAGGRPAGFCTVIIPGPDDPGAGWIDMLAVRPDERGHGLGARLVTGALDYLHDSGVDQAALCTQADNRPALALYEKLGFTRFLTAATWRFAR
ncbi:MAG: GNAT family N-acetyltransferase [Bacteroidales bacterium]|nr:GNAT family N-acetyltransferase [Candidatus Latescibacterota bacterium]